MYLDLDGNEERTVSILSDLDGASRFEGGVLSEPEHVGDLAEVLSGTRSGEDHRRVGGRVDVIEQLVDVSAVNALSRSAAVNA